MTCVHLLKARSDDAGLGRQDPYEELIENVQFIPIMKFSAVDFDGLCRHLQDDRRYDGVIVTSQRAVDVLRDALARVGRGLCRLPAYTVGPTTANRLELIGFSTVHGAETGNGSALAKAMIADVGAARRFLFLAGEVHRDILPRELAAAGHSVEKVVVYRTEGYDYGAELAKINSGDWVVFFSPSHVDQAVAEIRRRALAVKIAAIGPTTQQYLLDNGFAVDAVAESPTAQKLLDAIKNLQ